MQASYEAGGQDPRHPVSPDFGHTEVGYLHQYRGIPQPRDTGARYIKRRKKKELKLYACSLITGTQKR